MKIKIAATTDIGKVRENNEDTFIVCPDLSRQEWKYDKTPSYIPLSSLGALLVVADGMGGANAGEVASGIAVDTVKAVFSQDNVSSYISSGSTHQLLQKCIRKADDAINSKAWDDPATAGMGTTIVVGWIVGESVHIAWCGDSRAYIFDPQTGLKALTKDHSYVQELVDSGKITMQEAFNHPDSNLITRGLGDINSQSQPDIVSYPVKADDVLLLCSDGLSGYCTGSDIERVLQASYTDIDRCKDELLQIALQSGGHDNICIAMASMIDDRQEAPTEYKPARSWREGLRKLLNF